MIPLSSQSIESFTPPSLKGRKPEVLFHLSVPTPNDRDKVNIRLFAAGVIPVTPQDMRTRVIHEIFEALPDDEEEAERRASMIEDGTAADQLHQERMTGWYERERERLADILEGAPERPAEALPKHDMPLRRRTEYQMLWADTINQSQRLREMSAMIVEYGSDQRKMIARFHIVGWEGLETQREAVAEIRGMDVVTVDCLFAMRSEIGEVAWVELLDKTASLYDITRAEVGEFDSPPVNSLSQNGSEDRSGGSVKPDGASTKPRGRKTSRSNTTPTPAAGSPTTPASSSDSSGASGTRKASRRGRTAAAS